MASWVVVLGLAGCDFEVPQLFPEPPCEDRVDVDPSFGGAALVFDQSECARDAGLPTRVEYSVLLDRDWEPLTSPDADPCNTASELVLDQELEGGDFAVEPAWDEPPAEDTWIGVSFWERREGRADWSAYFRLGHRDEVVLGMDCLDRQ